MGAVQKSNGERRRLTILGSTGSIGCSTLNVVAHNQASFDIAALVGNSNIELLANQALSFRAELAVTADESRYEELAERLKGSGIEVAAGQNAVIEAAQRPCDITMAAIVGAAGLEPTLAAAKQGAIIALANKECLVCAGDVFLDTLQKTGTTLLPVDSEHSAVFQVLDQTQRDQIDKIILTASGGPFRAYELDALAAVTPKQALNHPNWDMGPKVTIDSSTLMNKGLELIEAYYLFPVKAEQLDAVIHRQSIVHSLVAYKDGSVLAQMGEPDMKTPIAYALGWPNRIPAPVKRLDLAAIGQLNFEPVDPQKFPAVNLCLGCLERGGSATTVMNAANEVAVAEFLSKKLAYLEITRLIDATLEAAEKDGMVAKLHSLEDVSSADTYGRERASELARSLRR
ncbi:MAG: 1-deoxy-D-xylulose-5-phosphate reductoisomerase [Hyphomicrobiales bacterium]